MIRPLTVEDLDYVIELVNARVSASDPLTLTGEDREQLAFCLENAFRSYAGWQLPQLERTAALLYWSIVTHRPLADGNKRVAVVATALLLIINGQMPLWTTEDLYATATTPGGRYDGPHQIKEDLALLIFSNIRPLTEQDLRRAAVLDAA